MASAKPTGTCREFRIYECISSAELSSTLYPGQGNSYLTPRSPIAMQVRTLAQERLVDLSTNLTKLHLYAHESPDPQSSVAHGGEAEIEAMMLWHYHFDAWPDHGVPRGKGVNALVALVKEIGRRRNELGGVDGCEVWVHWFVFIA